VRLYSNTIRTLWITRERERERETLLSSLFLRLKIRSSRRERVIQYNCTDSVQPRRDISYKRRALRAIAVSYLALDSRERVLSFRLSRSLANSERGQQRSMVALKLSPGAFESRLMRIALSKLDGTAMYTDYICIHMYVLIHIHLCIHIHAFPLRCDRCTRLKSGKTARKYTYIHTYVNLHISYSNIERTVLYHSNESPFDVTKRRDVPDVFQTKLHKV